MGLLMAFGDDANFVHQRRRLPSALHAAAAAVPESAPDRDQPRQHADLSRIRIEGYFAVTSNTVQFGARAELFFGLDAINVQGHIAFDALFQFSPFYFIIEISASLSVKVFGIGLFSVSIRGRSKGRRRGTSRATARSRCSSGMSTSISR